MVKLLAIVTISCIYFIVLAVMSFFLGKLIPDDKSESIEMSALIVVAYIGLLTAAFYIARTQLKHIPKVLDGMQGFNSDMLKEKDGSVLSGLGLLLFASPFVDRAFRIRDHLVKTVQF